MDEQLWQTIHIDALYPIAEDVYRLDPWATNIGPFVLMPPDNPDAYVVVLIEEDDEGFKDIRLLLGRRGLSAYLDERSIMPNEEYLSAEELINHFDGYYLEVGFNTPHINLFEKKVASNHDDRVITFRRQRPGYGLATIVDQRDLEHIGRYLTAIRQLLIHQQLETYQPLRVLKSNGALFEAPAFALNDGLPTPLPRFQLSQQKLLQPLPPVLDEFSAARLRHLPSNQGIYELFFFYLTVAQGDKKSMLPMTFFLVNMETGILEWSEVITPLSFPETVLHRLWQFFVGQNSKPSQILIHHTGLYTAVASDLREAGIGVEKIITSYVGDELLEGYLNVARLKEYHLLGENFPEDPYK